MNKKLAYSKTKDPYPNFIQVMGLNDEQGYVGTYGNHLICRGAAPIVIPAFNVPAHGAEVGMNNGFQHGETVKLFYYNSIEDKFYQLFGEIYELSSWNKVEQIDYIPALAVYVLINPIIGEEITLNVNDDAAAEIINIGEIPDPKPGENPTHIPLKTQNINNLTFEVQGKGEVYLQQHFPLQYMYNASPEDTNVTIKASGVGVYSDMPVTSIAEFFIEKAAGEGLFNNDYFTILENGGNIMLRSNLGEVSVRVVGMFNMAFNSFTSTERIWMPIPRWNQWVVQNGTVSGEYRVRDPQTKRWSDPISFTF